MPRPKDFVLWIAFAVGTVVLAAGSVWPFLRAWQVHETPAFEASRTWVVSNPRVVELVGGKAHLESDWFPKGGARDGHARFRHKVSGDVTKADIGVILEERDGVWVVTEAEWESKEGPVKLDVGG